MARTSFHRTSRLLSLVLRHRPDKIGIRLDDAGWVTVNDLLDALGRHGHPLTYRELRRLVASNDKRRFVLSADSKRIRAAQGHSLQVNLDYPPAKPPPVLFHGTVEKFLGRIRVQGLQRGRRHHVHLSPDEQTAHKVGARRGDPVILEIDAAGMHADGHVFHVSENGVWLTSNVPARFIVNLTP